MPNIVDFIKEIYGENQWFSRIFQFFTHDNSRSTNINNIFKVVSYMVISGNFSSFFDVLVDLAYVRVSNHHQIFVAANICSGTIPT